MTTPARLLRVLALAIAPLLAALAPPASAHTRAELEQMLAPIALYPDSVLSHVLIAATYPDEVEEAARWSRRHPRLHGEDAVDAVEDRDWDPSVKALVAFPEILARMDEDPDWTEDLGEAFLEHEAEVMDSVQVLRDHAYDAGHLRTTEHVRVIREREYIYIEPAVHHVVYVPYYDPWYVYGPWWWPSHPPYRWRHWHGHAVSHYGGGFYWGVGFRIAPTFYFTSFYWPERYVVVTHYRAPTYRPLYSGRHVARQPDVRHWRGERVRADDRPQRAERRRQEHSRPDSHPGRGADMRRPRDDDREERRGWRSAPDRDGQANRPQRRDDREARHEGREARRDEQGRRRDEDTQRRERDTRREERVARPAEPARRSQPEERDRVEDRGNGREEHDGRGRGRDDAPRRGKREEREVRDERRKNGERPQRDR